MPCFYVQSGGGEIPAQLVCSQFVNQDRMAWALLVLPMANLQKDIGKA